MPAFKYALPMLAAAGYAYAECSTTATTTIENSGDASAIATCTTFSGNIAVATGVSDDISFGQLKEIDGDLLIKNNQNIKRIDGAGLEKISGELSLLDNSQLAAVAFPKLDNVKKLTMIGLASLRNLGFDGGISNIEELSIENTQLQNLNGIDLNKTKSIRIIANPSIANISMGVTNMTGPMEIGDNNADVVVSFPNLEHAGNMSFRSVGNLSLPALKDISPGSFGIFKSKLKSFYASNFTEVKADLTISNCTELEDLSLPSLSKVGAFRIENTNLADITKLGKLKEANAALDISGKNLTKVEMPSLDYVKGVFNLQSQADLGNSCDPFNKLNDQGKLGPKSKFKCQGKLQQATNAGGNGGSSGSTQPSDNAASPIEVQTYLGLAGLLAVLFV